MTLTEFKSVLTDHGDKKMSFVLPGGKRIPAHYHITEVGHVKKDFIDCGGTIRSSSACVLQAWVAVNDEDHRLEAGKLATILKMAESILANNDLPVELEYEAPVLSQFTVTSSEIEDDVILFSLTSKHTDCLAKESCGLDGGTCCSVEEESEGESCCGPDAKSACC